MLAPPKIDARNTAPPTEKKPVTDSYHGVTVTDDYRWLEDTGTPAVTAWTQSQNRYARELIDALPGRAAIEQRLSGWYAKDTGSHTGLIARPGCLFGLKFQPPKQQRLLVMLASADELSSEKVILDPNNLEPKGHVAMDWFVPSPDGKMVAVALSEHGSEEGTLYFYLTASGERLPDRIARVQYPTGGGSAAWSADGRSIYYTRYPRAGERPAADLNFFQQIYLHRLGTPESDDKYCAGKDFPRIAEIDLHPSRDGRWMVAQVANGDGGEFAHYLHDTHADDPTTWRQLTGFADQVKAIHFSCDGRMLYLRSVKDAPRGKVLRMSLEASLGDAEVIIPQADGVIEGLTITHSYIYLSELIGGPSRIRRANLDGKEIHELPLPPNSGLAGVLALRERATDERLLVRTSGYIEPPAWRLYDPGTPEAGLRKTALYNTSPVDFSDIQVSREYATGKDGVKIPINILRRKGIKLDGSHPTLLTGYGGYGISMRPSFNFADRLWFDHGGVKCVANLRGGGEFGEEWHTAGNLTRKQTVFDDFAACASYLIHRGYTKPAKLAVEGGSNGGLLMGAMLTQHPDLIRAVVAHVGLYDMLRVELDANGAFNVTEFGSVKDAAQFKALYAYSPYHHVVDGTPYPAVFFLAGEKDGRVNPAHSRKMAARLQAATGSDLPVIVRLSAASGHGMGTALSERIGQNADVLAFLFAQLGMSP